MIIDRQDDHHQQYLVLINYVKQAHDYDYLGNERKAKESLKEAYRIMLEIAKFYEIAT